MSKYDIVDISTKFNKTIKQLINILENIVPNNTYIETIKRKIKISTDANPLLLLNEGGSYIFEFRDHIKNNKLDELFLNTENLLNETHKNIIDSYADKINNDEYNGIKKLLLILRESWVKMNQSEKKIVEKNIKILLSEYCKMLTLNNK